MDAKPPPSTADLPRTEQPVTTPLPAAIRIATTEDARFLDHLQKKFSNQVGFLPAPALLTYLERQSILIAEENDEPAGYILAAKRLQYQPLMRPIIQACVELDAQRRHHGLALLEQIQREAIAAGQVALQANCRADIEANAFWRAAGFREICFLDPKNARDQHVICWRKPLIKKVPMWIIDPPKRAGHRAGPPTLAHRQRK